MRIVRIAALLAVAVLACACDDKRAAVPPARASEAFVDATAASGLSFTHVNGMTGKFHFAEIIGSGVALLDYDNDGDLDLLVVQGGPLPGRDAKGGQAGESMLHLYRNDLVMHADGSREVRFVEVTEAAGLKASGYGMGIAVGDIDNDGHVDIFVTRFGAPNLLFRNNGDGTFADITRKAGVAGAARWGSSASFLDFDRDGYLDLYVANYVDYALSDTRKCYGPTSAQDYCAPTTYKPVPGHLYRNRGNGTFEDVSQRSGITRVFGNGLGVVAADVDGDGWPDIYVANDGTPNQLWMNRHDGTFVDEAPLRGAAVNADGAPEAGMGVDIADFDGNGTEDVLVTNMEREKTTLYVNLGKGMFEDRSAVSGLTAATSALTGFGTAFIDYDNDGWLDIVSVNGAVHSIPGLVSKGDPYPLHEKKQLLRNTGDARFVDVSASAGPAFALSEVGRGLAVGDVDNDGAIDFVVSNSNGPLRLFRNKVGAAHDWIGLRLVEAKRDAYGARVELRRKGAPTLWRRVRADGSYLSSNDPRVLIGLGANAQLDALVIHWPDGTREAFRVPATRRYTTLVKGTGKRA